MRQGRLVPVLLVAGVVAVPSTASAAVLQPLKPCYVSVSEKQRERVVVAGSAFTPGAVLDVAIDGENAGETVADAAGAFGPLAVDAPYRKQGVRGFVVTVTERDNPANVVEARTRVAALTLSVRPALALPRQRVKWRGRGFTGEGDIYAHYLRKGRHKRTVRLGRTSGPCGLFRVRARQFPFRPKVGRWVVRVDQFKQWTRRPRGVFWELDISVERAD